ncbi:MAG TPA: hypothetical protein VF161_00870 [Steroidobacteraceae bacterium]
MYAPPCPSCRDPHHGEVIRFMRPESLCSTCRTLAELEERAMKEQAERGKPGDIHFIPSNPIEAELHRAALRRKQYGSGMV